MSRRLPSESGPPAATSALKAVESPVSVYLPGRATLPSTKTSIALRRPIETWTRAFRSTVAMRALISPSAFANVRPQRYVLPTRGRNT